MQLLIIFFISTYSEDVSLAEIVRVWQDRRNQPRADFVVESVSETGETVERAIRYYRPRETLMKVYRGNTETVFGSNPDYGFSVQRANGAEDFKFNEVIERDKIDSDPRLQGHFMPIETPLEHLVAGGDVSLFFDEATTKVSTIRRLSSSQIEIKFEAVSKAVNSDSSRSLFRTGMLVVSDSPPYLPHFVSLTVPEGNYELVQKFEQINGELRLVSRIDTLAGSDGTIEKWEDKISYEVPPVTAKDFYLSAYGFAEPPFVRSQWSNNFNIRWVVFPVGIALIIFGFLLKRRRSPAN
jgi:hypothetical protein